jgi:hypothetical protein
MKIIGITPDGRTVYEHDGITEWWDCSSCGALIDGASDEARADGGCHLCGAPPEQCGLVETGGETLAQADDHAGIWE